MIVQWRVSDIENCVDRLTVREVYLKKINYDHNDNNDNACHTVQIHMKLCSFPKLTQKKPGYKKCTACKHAISIRQQHRNQR